MEQLGSPLPAADDVLEEGLPGRSGSKPDLLPKRSGICPNRDQSPWRRAGLQGPKTL